MFSNREGNVKRKYRNKYNLYSVNHHGDSEIVHRNCFKNMSNRYTYEYILQYKYLYNRAIKMCYKNGGNHIIMLWFLISCF